VQHEVTSHCASILPALAQGLSRYGLLCEACRHLKAACRLGKIRVIGVGGPRPICLCSLGRTRSVPVQLWKVWI